MTARRLIVAVMLMSGAGAWAAGPDATEMQDRARGVVLNRAVPLMEGALQAGELTPEQAQAVNLLLQEQRRVMLLFLNYSPLTGQELQDKLQQVLDVTQAQVETALHPAVTK